MVRLGGNDGFGFESTCAGVEAEVGFPFFLIESMTEKAVLREDGADIAVVGNGILSMPWENQKESKQEAGDHEALEVYLYEGEMS